MAYIAHHPGIMSVPQGLRPVPENFVSFLWDHEMGAFLVKEPWAGEPESGSTSLGLRIAAGSA